YSRSFFREKKNTTPYHPTSIIHKCPDCRRHPVSLTGLLAPERDYPALQKLVWCPPEADY
ncbi:unnamed protein product, partial [Candidula unifasciata]